LRAWRGNSPNTISVTSKSAFSTAPSSGCTFSRAG
jgi:hypothetical protein